MIKTLVKKIFSVFVVLSALLSGSCASLQPGDIPPQSAWEEPQPLRVEMDIDVFQMRLDLLRESKDAAAAGSGSLTVTDGSNTRNDRLVPYHYLGTYIGNGLFLDINGNVVVDIIRLLGFDEAYSFKLSKVKSGALIDAPQEISKAGRTITLNEGGWVDSDIVVQIEDEGLSLKNSMLFPPDKIASVDKRLEYLPSGLFSEFRKATIEQDGDITRGSTGYRVQKKSDDHLDLNGSYEIIRENDKIILQGMGNPIFTIVKSGDRYVFFRSQSYGSWIEKLPDRIRISDNGSITEYVYEIGTRPEKQPSARQQQSEERSQPVKRAKRGRVKTDTRVDRNTSREASPSLQPN
ncbi:MAG: hypothetical protein LBK13_04560 [Spirochaetales bacterium]|jgi:hypothetical protein|nr:hypothetical protein [Spirochaetales bacterium]